MHPQVFVGCATQDLAIAEAVQQKLEYDAEVELWTEGTFVPTVAALSSLLSKLQTVDFAILIATGADTLVRTFEVATSIDSAESVIEKLPVPRDNVVFELGLFMGALGHERTFLMVDRKVHDLTLPTDLGGITSLTYDSSKSNVQSAVGSACTTIKSQIKKYGSRGSQ